MPRITIAQLTEERAALIAKINALEEEMGVANARVEQLQAEVNAYLVAQRPSRHASERSSSDFQPTVQTTGRAAWTPSLAMQRARELAMRTGRVVRVG